MRTNFHEKRRNFYIKKDFQRKFILKFCSLVVLGAVISGVIIYMMSMATVTTTFENSRLAIKNTADYILPSVLFSGTVVIILVSMATIFITLLTSHKIGGALYAIERHVEEVASRNLQTKFRLRTDDEIKALAVGLDVMVHNLREGIVDVKEAVSKLEASADSPSGTALSQDFRNRLQELRGAVDKFKT